jgi:hypothetical protein
MWTTLSIIVVAAYCIFVATPSRAGGTPDATGIEGMTAFEYVVMTDGCTFIADDAQRKSCQSVMEKLLPQMVPDKPAPPFPKLTAAEVAAIEIGCGYVQEARDKMECASGIKKLRTHLSASN